MSNIFGGNTGMTYEDVQRKRALAKQLAQSSTSRAPRSVGEGLTAIGNALAGRSLERKAEKRAGELDAEWKTQVSGMGLDADRAAIYGRLPYHARDAALLQYMNQQDDERRAAASRGASAANAASKERQALEARMAIAQALQGQSVPNGAQMGPTMEAANAGATSGTDLSALQTTRQAPTQDSVVRALISNPNVPMGMIDDAVGFLPESPEPQYQQVQGADLGYTGNDANAFFNVSPKNQVTRIGGGGVTVNNNMPGQPDQPPQLVGTEGQALVQDPETGEWKFSILPNSKLDAERKNLAEKSANKDTIKETSSNVMSDEIRMAKELIKGQSTLSPATGLTGGLIQSLPFAESTRAGALGERLATIKANIGFDKLQSMRDASPTGGALGQVSEFENRLLQAVYGSLVQSQRAEDIDYNLDRISEIYGRVVNEGIPDDEARTLIREIEMSDFDEPKDDYETFLADPSAQAAAKKYGVTLEEMWAIKQGQK